MHNTLLSMRFYIAGNMNTEGYLYPCMWKYNNNGIQSDPKNIINGEISFVFSCVKTLK